ncbi:hypothetical protein OG21DRAFT_1526026 [Imleria badia]|nr:hypothetical protein OG21DRAFT_1526026 [Imleria badia]
MAVPDICIWISFWRSASQLAAMCKYIFVEMAFSQSEPQVMHKLKEYIDSHPHALAIMKIMIRESRYSSPSDSLRITTKDIGSDVLRNEEWRPELTNSNTFKVVCDGFTWIDITSIDITIWMCEGEAPINIEVDEPGHPVTAYTTGTLLPDLSTAALDALVNRATKKFQDIIVSYIEQTLLHAGLASDLGTHSHYKSWHKRLPKWPHPDPESDPEDQKGHLSQGNGGVMTRTRAKCT